MVVQGGKQQKNEKPVIERENMPCDLAVVTAVRLLLP